MKIILHMGYFISLIVLSVLSFFTIFGTGFVDGINTFSLCIPFVFSVLWMSDYTWRFFSINSYQDRAQLIFPTRTWTFISLFLAGIFTVYSLFLTTIIPFPIKFAPPWIFLGTPTILLLCWFWLLNRYNQFIKGGQSQWLLNTVLFILSLIYTYQIMSLLLNG